LTKRLVTLVFILAATLLRVDAPVSGSASLVTAVGPIGMTVSDADRSAAFYARVLGFEKVFDTEVTGEDYERLPSSAPGSASRRFARRRAPVSSFSST
jgi:hypothetical protein